MVSDDNLFPALRKFLACLNDYRDRDIAYRLATRQLDLTNWDLRIIKALNAAEAKELPFAELTAALSRESEQRVHSSTVSLAITRLVERHKLLDRDRNLSPRNPRITLTRKGREVADAIADADIIVLPQMVKLMKLDDSQRKEMGDKLITAMAEFESHSRKGTIAGVYDCFLGGHSHSVLDHEMAEAILRKYENSPRAAIENRLFLRRAVRYASSAGIRQFLDLGSGLPTSENTHQIVTPDANVVYVDFDESVVAKSQQLLHGRKNTAAICYDVRNTHELLSDPLLSSPDGLIDFGKPVAVVMVALLHFVKDLSVARDIVRVFRERLAPGSYIILSHAYRPDPTTGIEDVVIAMESTYGRLIADVTLRSFSEISTLLDGLELVPPGLVATPLWHPEIERGSLPPGYTQFSANEAWRALALCGVGKKL
jgi:SAM-dependent methyltransferase/DNA-binding MarR family transcriptional regulator